LTVEAMFATLVALGALTLLAVTRLAADVVFLAAMVVLVVVGALPLEDALSGFGSEGVITVGAMYVVAAGLRETGAARWLSSRLLGRPKGVRDAQLRLMVPVAAVSGFLNNTPLVAVMIPTVSEWAKKHGISVSRLLMPLSHAAVLGGTITLIGTSTNLVVNGLLREQTGSGLGLFVITPVGLAVTVVGVAFVVVFAKWLVPERLPVAQKVADAREYSVEMTVAAGGPLEGKTVAEAGLDRLGEVTLTEVEREGAVVPGDLHGVLLQAGDRLHFVGVVDAVVDLQRTPGLTPAGDQVFKLEGPRPDRILVEAVVSDSGPMVGRTIKEGRFRSLYGAVVVAIARNGRRLSEKVGEVVLRPGDTLLLEADRAFVETHRNVRDFYLLSAVPDSSPPRYERMGASALVLAGLVVVATMGVLPIVVAGLLAALAMVVMRCVSADGARQAIDWPVLITIGAAIGVGRSLEATGVTAMLSAELSRIGADDLRLNLLVLYVATAIVTELVTNNAAAALMFPVGMAMAAAMDASVVPFAITIMMAASCSFITPIGYQTNLMVYGPGGYRFHDFVVLGLPLTLVVGAVTVFLVPLLWGG